MRIAIFLLGAGFIEILAKHWGVFKEIDASFFGYIGGMTVLLLLLAQDIKSIIK